MNTHRHGLSVDIKRVGNEIYLTLGVSGKLTHEDYELFTPMLESALASVEHPQVKALLDMSELEGWEIRAAWDDLKLGLKHGKEFKKVAFLSEKKWHELAAKIGSWFIAGEVKHFESLEDAKEWLGS